jgi:phosphate transport system substrate-binding protein
MKLAKRTLAILTLAVSVGCTRQLVPATPPPTEAAIFYISSTHAAKPLLQTLMANYYDSFPEQAFETSTGNYAAMQQSLANGNTSYFLSQHLPSNNEIVVWAAPLAQDGLALIVHPSNPIQNMTTEQIRRIYRGYISNWTELDGADLSITLYSRETGSGTRLEFERMIMGRERTSPNAQILPSTQAMLEQVANDPTAIAYIPLSQSNDGVQILSINGIRPSLETIEDNIYPLRYTLFIIGLAEPEDAYRDFVGWSQGLDGQAALSGQFAPLPR